jgi:hypothetical protein
MTTQTPSTIQDTPVRESSCCYCGADDQPMHGKDIRQHTGQTWRLASACIDAHACSKRAAERDAHMDERYSLTAAGVAALQAAQRQAVA